MEYIEFAKKIPKIQATKSCSEQTIKLWFVIYSYILEHGYADTADTPEFVDHINKFRKISSKTINNHLRRMSEAGIIRRNVLVRKLPPELKEEFFNSFISFISGTGDLPSKFTRYCLPDVKCPVEFKSAEQKVEKTDRAFQDLRSSKLTERG